MQLSLFFRILRSRFWLIFAILLVTVASAIVASFVIPKVYSPTVVLVVDVKAMDPVLGGAVNSPQTVRGVLATQKEVIQSDRVVHGVIRDIGLDKREDVVRAWTTETGGGGDIVGWLAKGMLKRLEVTPSTEGSTLAITYNGSDPQSAADIANAFARHYMQAMLSLRAGPARESAGYFEQQVGAYRERLKSAQAKLSTFQQATGMAGTDERFDIENLRLQELSTQLVSIQAVATEGRARRDAVARDGRESMPEVVQSLLLQSLKTDLSRAEAKLQELSARLGPSHPQYQSAQAEVEALRSRLNAEIEKVSGSILTTSRMTVQREAEIRNAFEAQRAKVLRLRKDRDQLVALEREVDEAQKALALVAQRLTQTNLESQAPQSNVSLLSPALPPAEPSRPKPLLNVVVGTFVGLLLGMLAAIAIETFRRPVRTAEDLVRAIEVPVLAVLPPASSRRAQRLIGGTGPTITPPSLRLGN